MITPVVCGCCVNNQAPAELTVTLAGVGNGLVCGAGCAAINGTYVLQHIGGCGWRLAISKCPNVCLPAGFAGFHHISATLSCPVDAAGVVRPSLLVTVHGDGEGPDDAGGDVETIYFGVNLAPYAAINPAGRPNCCAWLGVVLPFFQRTPGCAACDWPSATATVTAGAC